MTLRPTSKIMRAGNAELRQHNFSKRDSVYQAEIMSLLQALLGGIGITTEVPKSPSYLETKIPNPPKNPLTPGIKDNNPNCVFNKSHNKPMLCQGNGAGNPTACRHTNSGMLHQAKRTLRC